MNTKKDFYWLNNHSRLFLSRGYLEDGVEPETRLKDIADAAESILKIKGFSEKFFGYITKGFYSIATPIFTNFGKQKGLPVSCFGSFIPDITEGIFDKVSEVAIMSKNGGGTSGYFGELRPRGFSISAGGKTDGPTRFMELFDKTADVISQGSSRRGSFAAYLPVEHPDIEEFLRIRSDGHPIQNMSIGVTITDKWMHEMKAGDKAKRKIWGSIIQKRFETGYPYIFFSDTVNSNGPKVYANKNLKINASNLCVAPETLIYTKQGHKTIKDLAGQYIEIWNGNEWSLSRCEKTGENQKLITVILKNGCSITCTPYHKFYVDGDNWVISSDPKKNKESDVVETQAIDLKPGDKVQILQVNYTNNYHYLSLVEIESVTDRGRTDDTYCVNEPINHKAIFNGILTGNCSEIALSSDKDNSFVCVLSSLNLLHWDEIVNTDAVETLIYFLDAVNEEFVLKTEGKKHMEAPHNFAKSQRALGMGVLGWHSFLQSKSIPFESFEAKLLNSSIWTEIRKRADKATEELAKLLGEPELLKGYGRRNVTTLAVAPTTSSSFILGQVSPSTEPLNSNYFVKKLAKGSFTYKNPYLKEILKEIEQDTDETWKNILNHGGSVQQLPFLNENQKAVFKTFGEISQKEIVIQAIQRQKHIDQSQSLNLMIPHDTKPKEASDLLIYGWENGIKTFYYQRSTNPAQQLSRSILTCTSCEA